LIAEGIVAVMRAGSGSRYARQPSAKVSRAVRAMRIGRDQDFIAPFAASQAPWRAVRVSVDKELRRGKLR